MDRGVAVVGGKLGSSAVALRTSSRLCRISSCVTYGNRRVPGYGKVAKEVDLVSDEGAAVERVLRKADKSIDIGKATNFLG